MSGSGRGPSYTADDILRALGNKRLGTTEIADALNCHRDTAQKRLDTLENRGVVTSTELGRSLLWERTNRTYAIIPIDPAFLNEYEETVHKPVSLMDLSASKPPIFSESDTRLRAWTLPSTDTTTAVFDQLLPGDRLLFYQDKTVIGAGELRGTLTDEDFARALWTTAPEDREHILLFDSFRQASIPEESLTTWIDPPISRYQCIEEPEMARLFEAHGTFEEALTALDQRDTPRLVGDKDRARQQLEEQIRTDPQPSFTEESAFKAGKNAKHEVFTNIIPEIYGHTCAVCASSREAPDGTPEVEATYIYPRERNGAIDLRNGLALCQLHQWAVTTGCLSFTDDKHILVATDSLDSETTEEFAPLQDQPLAPPDNSQYSPHSNFLQAHRDLHNLED